MGELAFPGAQLTIGLEKLSAAEAVQRGAKALVIGVADQGGIIASSWRPALIEALRAGLDIISGLHGRLEDDAEIAAAARDYGRTLHNIRIPPARIAVGTGAPRSGKRLLTVGTDCALGKKYTALAIAQALKARGIDADFRATGQTGILIAGGGIPIDAVVSDFISGAAEAISPAAAEDHWDIIEGQGSLFQPSYAAVTLGLLHGSQPDVIVLCHEAGREIVLGNPAYRLPPLTEAIDTYLLMGRLTNPAIRCAGISMNTASLSAEKADAFMRSESDRLGLPVADPVRGGEMFERLVSACIG